MPARDRLPGSAQILCQILLHLRRRRPRAESGSGARIIPAGGGSAAAGREQRKTFIYVNNRLEGNALATIEAMLELASVSSWNHFHGEIGASLTKPLDSSRWASASSNCWLR
jgi:hypothetical protein